MRPYQQSTDRQSELISVENQKESTLHDSMRTLENTSVAALEISDHGVEATVTNESRTASPPLNYSDESYTYEGASSSAGLDVSNRSNSNSTDENSPRRRKRRSKRIDVNGLLEASQRSQNQYQDSQEPVPIWQSQFAVRLYMVVAVALYFRKFWVLQGISILILLRILSLLVSWFFFVASAREIGQCKRLALWWMDFGLGIVTKTVEGSRFHQLLFSNTFNFWKNFGVEYGLDMFKDVNKENRQKILQQAKANLNRTQMSSIKMKNVLKMKS